MAYLPITEQMTDALVCHALAMADHLNAMATVENETQATKYLLAIIGDYGARDTALCAAIRQLEERIAALEG